jgi:hypothetical protein
VVPVTKDVTVYQTGTIPGSKLFAIIFGVLLATAICCCVVGIFAYRRYKRQKDEQELERAATEIDNYQKKKINTVDAINQSVESPLKSHRDNTIFDDEANYDEQYHPSSHRMSYSFWAEGNYDTGRKANEVDGLMKNDDKSQLGIEDNRRTRDQFFDEAQQRQPTFGAPDSDKSLSLDISDGEDSEKEDKLIGEIETEKDFD